MAGVAGKEQIRQHKDGPDQRDVAATIAVAGRHADGEEGQDHLVDIVVEGPEKLGDDQTK